MICSYQISFVIFLLTTANAFTYYYTKNFVCGIVDNTNNICQKWSSTGTISLESYSCFPQNTTVRTRYGNKRMKDLVIGDEIYSYNVETQTNQFSQLTSWLHRDTQKKFKYVKILNSENNIQITSSKFHNIATVQNQKIEYQFSKNLLHKNIISHQKRSYQVNKLENDILVGIYAPYVKSGNFYIANQLNTQQLFLVHSFAHIKKPELYQSIFSYGMWISQLLDLNIQPEQNQYRHPLTKILQQLFPEFIERQVDNQVYSEIPTFKIEQYYTYNDYYYFQRQITLEIGTILSASTVLQVPLIG